MTQPQPLEAAIVLERAKSLIDQLIGVIPQLNELKNLSEEAKKQIEEQITSYALSLRTTKLKPEELAEQSSHQKSATTSTPRHYKNTLGNYY